MSNSPSKNTQNQKNNTLLNSKPIQYVSKDSLVDHQANSIATSIILDAKSAVNDRAFTNLKKHYKDVSNSDQNVVTSSVHNLDLILNNLKFEINELNKFNHKNN